ncbi:Transposon Ty3-I Gag-Pol polyprotein [Gossypium australe]|uniref:Transposon Ty3-I Gag-Pol polyprotein n=1 Tax=Gossypium australe TaxID=47621 RepID=A0A5B6WHX7_9ROSI|nr:Transposon Ty3-I Gag-Pol polyprotein [Gossypium australe]
MKHNGSILDELRAKLEFGSYKKMIQSYKQNEYWLKMHRQPSLVLVMKTTCISEIGCVYQMILS